MLMVVAGCGSGALEVLTVEDEQIYDVDVAGVVRDIERASSQPAGRTTGGPFSAVAAGPGTVTLANDNSFSFGTDTPIGNFCDDGLPDSTRPVCYVAVALESHQSGELARFATFIGSATDTGPVWLSATAVHDRRALIDVRGAYLAFPLATDATYQCNDQTRPLRPVSVALDVEIDESGSVVTGRCQPDQ